MYKNDTIPLNIPKLKYLAIDDDEMCLELLKNIFAEEADVICHTSGEDGLSWLENHSVDLILLDFRMPGMSGFDVLHALHNDSRYAEIPVVILTGDIDAELESDVLISGATDFIRKPFIPEVVRLRVHKIIKLEYLQKSLHLAVQEQTALAEQRLQESQQMFDQMTTVLAKAIDAKDFYTSGHSERVAKYSREILKIYGGDAAAQKKVFYMGLLHDIGKIGIPRQIITKPSKLTEEEYTIIKQHTSIGYQILQSILVFPELAIGAQCHHERFDGLGYPSGLKGEEIPLLARVLAVADSYDAMTSKRSYRNALPQKIVKDELRKGKGTQFDPRFADIMISMIEHDHDYNMREI